MRVALDTNALFVTQAGVARHTRGLIRGLQQIANARFTFFPLAWENENFGFQQPQRALKTFYRELIWAKLLAPARLRREKADVLHAAAGVLVLPPPGVRHVATVHDLAILRHPERYRRWHRWSARHRLAHLPTVDRIIAISRFTAEELMNLLAVPASRIEVVYNGLDFGPDASPPAELKPGFEVPPEYFLFVGSLEPGKNLALLRDAYRCADRDQRPLPPLLIVGSRWSGVGREGPPPEPWHYLGRQSDAILVYLFRRALGLVFPSKYEGFGLPVGEAMALGCPVICSPVASLPEVGGDAALYAGLQATAYCEAMQRLARDSALRERLIALGRVQALKFSWKKCAQETVAVYNSVLK